MGHIAGTANAWDIENVYHWVHGALYPMFSQYREYNNMLSNNLIEKSRRLPSINNCIRSKENLISPILNEIDGIVDLDILKNLKIFSSTIKDLEEKIEAATSKLPPSLPSSAVTESLKELTKKIAEFIDEIMPPQFIQSMLILSKNQLHKYKLHKIVLYESNEYIQETC
ncbi:10460_t:CDS:2 [Funneliformis geosporum]|nr:10460_t:CDS:2 [Funneliformis geosporum]